MSQLEQAARAVLDRWDSPRWDWNQEGPTADLMAALRAALDAGQAQPVAWIMQMRLRHQGTSFTNWLHEGDKAPPIYSGWVPLYAAPPAQPVAPAGWLPIETAPMDGTEILAIKPTLRGPWLIVRWLDDHPDCEVEGFHEAWSLAHIEGLTHWMPLPLPPGESK